MKIRLGISILAITFLFLSNVGFAQTQKEEFFSTKGVITNVDTDTKTLLVKTEGGLELTFHSDEATQVTVGQETQSFSSLAQDNSVEIDYFYNKNYEKVAITIRKEPSGAVSS